MLVWRDWFVSRGFQMVCGDPGLVGEIKGEMEGRLAAGEFDAGFYESALQGLEYNRGTTDCKWNLVLVAVPRPAHRLNFTLEKGSFGVVVPPTYINYRKTAAMVSQAIQEELLEPGQKIIFVEAPLKPLAARLGLVVYGRNNITYSPGLGSFHQLIGFLTDAEPGPWAAAKAIEDTMAKECRTCKACQKACPTGAIGGDRFLLHGERCLTLYNENQSPWPDWLVGAVEPKCLVGCLVCQEMCPMNKGLLRYETLAPVFDRAETERLLAGAPDENDPLWRRVKEKIEEVGLPAYAPVLGRNLRMLRGK